MTLQLFARKSCRESQKAERWLKERGISFARVDVDLKFPSLGELESLARALGAWDLLIDRESSFWKKSGFEWKVFDIKTELSENPQLLRTPLLRDNSRALQGFEPESYQTFLKIDRAR